MSAPAPHAPSFPSRPELAVDNVHAIAVHKSPSAQARHARLLDRWHAAWSEARDCVHEVARDASDQELQELFEAYSDAEMRLRCYWENRATALARHVRDLLGCRETTAAQRGDVIATLYGRSDTLRDANLLSDPERQMLEHYRTLTGADKAFVFTLAKRLIDVAARENGSQVAR